jgi:phage FluMu protein Com
MVQHLPDNAEPTFKCAKCGHMFATGGTGEAKCPQCGFECTAQSCVVLDASNEDY